MLKQVFITTLFLFIGYGSFAQLEIQGVIRPRAEFRNGYSRLRDSTTHAAYFISQRTRLSLFYKNDKIKTKITFYDARIWGNQLLKSDLATVGLIEGWAELDLNSKLSVKFGRQIIKYDNSRLFSSVNWNQIGAAHDAVIIKFRPSNWQIDLGMAFSQSEQSIFGTDYSDLINSYKTLNFLWVSKKINRFTLSSFTIMDGYQSDVDINKLHIRYTPGLIVKYDEPDFNIAGRGFYQGGKNNDGLNLSAWYLRVEGSIKLNDKFKPMVGIEIKSGNPVNDSLATTDEAFNILYGARHKFNGSMDYFNLPSTTNGAGLVNPYLKMQWTFNPKFNLTAAWHYFSLQGNYVFDNESIDKYLGQEIDLTAYLKIHDYLGIEGGYSVMFATNTMAVIKGGDPNKYNSWAYVMVTVDPVFFKSK